MTRKKAAAMEKSITRAFDIIRDMVEHPEKYPEDTVILAPDHVGQVFSTERARLYMVVQERGELASVSDLADILKRDIGSVSRDLALLEGYGLLRIERAGKSKRVVAERKPVVIVA